MYFHKYIKILNIGEYLLHSYYLIQYNSLQNEKKKIENERLSNIFISLIHN